tara:strand:- start:2336 stop:2539 length:204 start_codon:yes stop_codon:yes gene_type:complete
MTRYLDKSERIKALECFAQGLGVEDIAVIHGFPVENVRLFMRQLSDDGVFDRVYSNLRLKQNPSYPT